MLEEDRRVVKAVCAAAVLLLLGCALAGCSDDAVKGRRAGGPNALLADRPESLVVSAQAFQTLSLELALPFESNEALGKRAEELGMHGGPLIWRVADDYGETAVFVPSGWSRNYVDVTLTFTPKAKQELNPGLIEALGQSFRLNSLVDPDELIFERVEKGTDTEAPGEVRNSEVIAVGLPRGVWRRTMRMAHWTVSPPRSGPPKP